MADPQEYTDAQLSDGRTLRFIGSLEPDQVREKVQAFRLKESIAANPPGVPKPNTNLQPVDLSGNPQNPGAGVAAMSGASSSPAAATPAYSMAVGGPIGAAGAVMGGSTALPFLGAFAARHPLIATMAAQEAIHQARTNLPGGKYIPAAAEWLPFLINGAKTAKAEPEAAGPGTDQLPGRPYKPNPRYEPRPEPEPLPQRSGQLLLNGEVQSPSPSLPFLPKPKQVQEQLERGLGNEPMRIQPGVPIGKQNVPTGPPPASVIPGHTPVESSALNSYKYDPAAREFHVSTKSGGTYIYGDVPPEDVQAFEQSQSKGSAFQQIRRNPLVGKVVNGKRVAVKPVSRSDQGNDLTDILTRSLQAARSGDQ